jgi:hypothetical protein
MDITAKEQLLESMKNNIEKMGKIHHMEILKILKKYPAVKLNENRNGVYINVSYLPDEVIEELQKFLEYLQEQESNLELIETQKEEYKHVINHGTD